jgi:hypothetical protein
MRTNSTPDPLRRISDRAARAAATPDPLRSRREMRLTARSKAGHGRASGPRVGPHRSFDPRRVGSLECAAWVAYYRREWPAFLRSAVALTRHTFGLPWLSTLRGAWLVLRANQLWAPIPDNDPAGARRAMERFYRLVVRRHGESFDPGRAATLEVEWWRVHREHQGTHGHSGDRVLVDALGKLYSYVYGVPQEDVRVAAEQRALAMRHSDQWVRDGCELSSPLIAEERAALVRSYAGLLAAIHRL